MRRKTALLCLAFITATAVCSAPGRAHFAPVEQEKVPLADTTARDITAETSLYCLALAVFFEGGSTGETEEGQRHIAHVVVSRARANRKIWGGSNICDVVFYKRGTVCQFSFACLPVAKRTVRGGAAWEYSKRIAQDELEGRSGVQSALIRYYMNAALSAPKHACRFRKEFVPVVQVGRHEFFREATREERRELEKADYAECRKYEASLRKKKSKRARNKASVALAKNKSAKKVTIAKR